MIVACLKAYSAFAIFNWFDLIIFVPIDCQYFKSFFMSNTQCWMLIRIYQFETWESLYKPWVFMLLNVVTLAPVRH